MQKKNQPLELQKFLLMVFLEKKKNISMIKFALFF